MKEWNVSRFLSQWHAAKRASLPLDLIKGLEDSYQAPESFWKALFDYFQEKTEAPQLRSRPFHSYDFYYDCVIRHLGKQRIAFKSIQENSTAAEWSYDAIHGLVNAQVADWKKHSFAKPHQKVALVMPIGIHFVVSLLAILRLGLNFTFLPTDSPSLPLSRINDLLLQLDPAIVITTSEESHFIDDQVSKLVIDRMEALEERSSFNSHLYDAFDVVQQSLSCYSQQEMALTPLNAHDMYLHPLRDGLLSLNLEPGLIYSSPLSCSLKEQPCSLLITLLCGATILHIPPAIMERAPQILKKEEVHILGISLKLKKLWASDSGLPHSNLKLWHKNPIEEDELRWETFAEANHLQKVPMSQCLFDNSQGGISLVSPPVMNQFHYNVWPNTGTPWKLLQMHQMSEESPTFYGVFGTQSSVVSQPSAKEMRAGNLMLTQFQQGWVPCGTISPNRHGQTYPCDELEAKVSQLEFVKHCAVLSAPQRHFTVSQQFILLVFVSPYENEIEEHREHWMSAISAQIKHSIGPVFIPDIIEFYKITPKTKNGQIDHSWCFFQYNTGVLQKKKDLRAFHLLSRLRASIQNTV